MPSGGSFSSRQPVLRSRRRTARRAGALVKGGRSAGSRSPIRTSRPMAGLRKPCSASADCGTRMRPQLVLGDTISQAAQFATTGNAVGGLIAYSLVLAPGFADRGTLRVDPEGGSSAAATAYGAPEAGRPGRDAVLRVLADRARARDPPEARIRGAAVAGHGLDGSARLAVARRRHRRDPAAVRHLVRPPARLPRFSRQAAGRSARHRAARAAADGARVLPARHLRRALAARPGVPVDRRAVAAVLVRGPARSRRRSPTSRSSSSRFSAASRRFRRTCAMRRPAAA